MQLTVRDLRDLAHGDAGSRRPNLRLAVAEGRDDSGGDYLSANDLSVAGLACRALATRHDDDLNGRALRSPRAVIQVVKVTTGALIEDSRTAQGKGAVRTGREARGVNCTSLRGAVELELVIGCDVSSSSLSVLENTVLQLRDQNAVGGAVTALLFEMVSHNVWL